MRLKERYAYNTYFILENDWFTAIGGRAMCHDGIVRKLMWVGTNPEAGKLKAKVNANGKTVSGIVEVRADVLRFYAWPEGKNFKCLGG